MAGQRKLEAAAQRGAVDRGRYRLAAGLELAVGLLQLAAPAIDFGRVGTLLEIRDQPLQIGAGHERVLAGGNYCTFDLVVAGDFFRRRRDVIHELGRYDIHRFVLDVNRQDCNSILIDLEIYCFHFC